MFQEQLEKGLFTFYWEETHNEHRQNHPTYRSQVIDPSHLLSTHHTPMEEKQPSSNRAKPIKQASSVKKHQSYLYFQIEKQNKDVLVPHHITLDPLLAHPLTKTPRGQRKGKNFKETSKLKTVGKEEEEEEATPIEKLLLSDEGGQCHKKTLAMDPDVQGQTSSVSTLRPGKVRKATLKESHSKQSLPSGRFPLIKAGEQSSHHKKLRKVKQNFLLERICLEKGQSSVVNIGISSVDDYKERWRKRKAEFMALLSHSDAREAV